MERLKTSSLIDCACGCGNQIEPFNRWGYKRKFIHGHYVKLNPPWLGKMPTKEHLDKLQEGRKKVVGERHPMWGKKPSIETIVKISKTWFQKGLPPWNKGKNKGNKKRIELLENGLYRNQHKWVERKLGKPNLCSKCGETKGKFSWSNKSGEYKYDLDDWQRLCISCHIKYDINSYKK